MTRPEAKELSEAIRKCVYLSITSLNLEAPEGVHFDLLRSLAQKAEADAYRDLQNLLWSGEEAD